MYSRLQEMQPGPSIVADHSNMFIVPCTCLSTQLMERYHSIFGKCNPDAFAIYIPEDNGVLFLGTFTLRDRNISLSPNFPALTTELDSCGYDVHTTGGMRRARCKEIAEWRFDISLKEKDLLRRIISFMLTACWNNVDLLWVDGKELSFHPVNGNSIARLAAIRYFSNIFMSD